MFSLFMLVVGMIVGAAFCFIYFAAVKGHYDLLSLRESALRDASYWLIEYNKLRAILGEWDAWYAANKESVEFWQWNRKYNRGAITQYRQAQRAKKRLGIK